MTVEGEFYHKSCFRCAHGGCSISPSNYAALDGFLYCKPHFAQLFKEKGSYNNIARSSSLKKNELQQAAEKALESNSEGPKSAPPEPADTASEAEAAAVAADEPKPEQEDT